MNQLHSNNTTKLVDSIAAGTAPLSFIGRVKAAIFVENASHTKMEKDSYLTKKLDKKRPGYKPVSGLWHKVV